MIEDSPIVYSGDMRTDRGINLRDDGLMLSNGTSFQKSKSELMENGCVLGEMSVRWS